MRIKDAISDRIDNFRAKRIQKSLIKTEDNEAIVRALPREEENFNIDIHKIVKSMDDGESRVKVVDNNIDEIIEQNAVRDTLKHLPDVKTEVIVKNNEKKLKESQKIKNAILAIKSNERKLALTKRYVKFLGDFEVIEIFDTLKPENGKKEKKKLQEEKVEIIFEKIMYHIEKYGSAWHIGELVETLENRFKLSVLTRCLEKVKDRQNRLKLTGDLLRATNTDYDTKNQIVEVYRNYQMLTEEEEEIIKAQLLEDKLKAERR